MGDARSETNQEYLQNIVNTDAGSSLIGEFAFGTYDSSIHWDIVKDMRKDSKILLDNVCIFENGKYLI